MKAMLHQKIGPLARRAQQNRTSFQVGSPVGERSLSINNSTTQQLNKFLGQVPGR